SNDHGAVLLRWVAHDRDVGLTTIGGGRVRHDAGHAPARRAPPKSSGCQAQPERVTTAQSRMMRASGWGAAAASASGAGSARPPDSTRRVACRRAGSIIAAWAVRDEIR